MNAVARPFLFASLLACVSVGGCIQREQLNSGCKWVLDPAVPLDLSDPAQQRHLNEDVMHAEELGVRYSDARIPPPRPALQKAGAHLREQCIASLLVVIAHKHSVPLAEVVEARGRRDPRWDVAMVLVLAIFYVFAVWRLVRWISSRFGGDWWPTVIAVAATSFATSAVGVVVGELWFGVMESARFGWTGHMSFRGSRVPWQYHRAEFFVAGVVLFWLTALVDRTVALSTTDNTRGKR